MDEKRNLPELPKSTDKFWDKAIKYQVEVKKKPPHEHFFEYRSGREIVCKTCPIGYFLSGKEYIENGQLRLR